VQDFQAVERVDVLLNRGSDGSWGNYPNFIHISFIEEWFVIKVDFLNACSIKSAFPIFTFNSYRNLSVGIPLLLENNVDVLPPDVLLLSDISIARR